MKKRDTESEMSLVGWLILAVIVLGLLGYGPCAGDCRNCGPQHRTTQTK